MGDICNEGPVLTLSKRGLCTRSGVMCNNASCSYWHGKPISFYLGSSIDLSETSSSIFYSVLEVLCRYGSVFKPGGAFSSGYDNANYHTKFIVDINMSALRLCTMAVFVWDLKGVSVGLPMEIIKANEYGKKSIIFCDDTDLINRSVYLKHFINLLVRDVKHLDDAVKREVCLSDEIRED